MRQLLRPHELRPRGLGAAPRRTGGTLFGVSTSNGLQPNSDGLASLRIAVCRAWRTFLTPSRVATSLHWAPKQLTKTAFTFTCAVKRGFLTAPVPHRSLGETATDRDHLQLRNRVGRGRLLRRDAASWAMIKTWQKWKKDISRKVPK